MRLFPSCRRRNTAMMGSCLACARRRQQGKDARSALLFSSPLLHRSGRCVCTAQRRLVLPHLSLLRRGARAAGDRCWVVAGWWVVG